MGRFNPTATMQVYQFESQWNQFWRAPSQVKREAFAELIAMAHYHAAAIAHAASPCTFEMILLTMLVGVVRRAETLQAQCLLPLPASPDVTPPLQASLRVVMNVLQQRLLKQKHELYTFARALRTEDQIALRALLAITPSNAALVPFDAGAPTDELLLTSLVEGMRQIRRIEKQQEGRSAIASLEEWTRICAAV